MPEANEAIQTALEQAAAGGDAESQSANESSPEVAEALKSVLKTGEETSASDESTDKSAEDTGKEPKTVPYERLAQVVQQKNEAIERSKSLEDKFNTATAREEELRTRIGNMEQDTQILDAIKNLAQDDRYRDHVVAIDRALNGLDDEVKEAEASGDKAAQSDAEQRFDQKAAELDTILADQRVENLYNETAGSAKEMLAQLPEQYTDKDRAIIGKLWTSSVDWNAIEEKGSEAIPDALNTSFAAVIKEYDTPQGALVAQTIKEIEDRVPEAKIVSSEDRVKSLLEKDWAETDDKGVAVNSDEAFSQGVAELLRATNSGA